MVLCLAVLLAFDRAAGDDIPVSIQNLLEDSCLDCHEGDASEGGFDLSALGFDLTDPQVAAHWINVATRVERGEMPPVEYGPIDEQLATPALSRLIEDLVVADRQLRGEHRGDLRRLTDTEITATLDVLFGPSVRPSILAADIPSGHFDNETDLLPITGPVLDSIFMATAAAIDAAIQRHRQPLITKRTRIEALDLVRGPKAIDKYALERLGDSLVIQHKGKDWMTMTYRWKAPATGHYDVRLLGRAYQSEKPQPFYLRAGDINDKAQMRLIAIGQLSPEGEGSETYRVRLNAGEGMFLYRAHGKPNVFRHKKTPLAQWDRDAIVVDGLQVNGPFIESAPGGDLPVLDSAIAAVGGSFNTAEQIERVLHDVAAVALRTAEPAVMVAGSMPSVVASLRDRPDDPAAALQAGLQSLLVNPRFFMHVIDDAELDNVELITRLSYGIHSRPVSQKLLESANGAAAANDTAIAAIVAQMLRDDNASVLYERIADHWFGLKHFNDTTPDESLYPEWGEYVADSALRQTVRYTRDLFESNRPVTELIACDSVFLNEPLSDLYEIPAPDGDTLVRVALPPNSLRGGLWTQPAIAKITANGTSSTPILRGLWVVETLLDRPPPPPPKDIPAIEPDIRGATTIREQLALHQVGSCANCHAHIDPWGYALESFDPAGNQRTTYRLIAEKKYRLGDAVDASGELATGEAFNDIRDLRRYLTQRPEMLARTAVHRLVTAVTGQSPQFADRPAVDAVLRQCSQEGYRMRDLLVAVCQSPMVTQR